MTESHTTTSSSEIVPLAERLRYLRLLRVAIVAVVMIAAVVTREEFSVGIANVARWTAAYFTVALVLEMAWRLLRARNLTLFGTTMIIDGIYLAWVAHVAGSGSALTYLVLVHVTTVCLLASHRTGIKLAVWHSILAFIVHYAVQSDIVLHDHRAIHASDTGRLTILIILIWVVAMSTATFSAVNERELRRRRVDLEAFAEFAAALEDVRRVETVAEVTLDHVIRAFDFARGLLVRFDGTEITVLATHGTSALSQRAAPDQVMRD